MNPRQNGEENGADGTAPLVIVKVENGFKVYSPADPRKSCLVTGSSEDPACTCTEFQQNALTCRHIEAVRTTFGGNGAQEEDRYAVEERLAIQHENGGAQERASSNQAAAPTQMLVKRSVSPDGRIDSLSVEFSTPVDESAGTAVVNHAARLLGIQAAIVKGFLNGSRNGGGTPAQSNQRNQENGAVLAEMVSIGGMDGKWGRRLFITLQAGSQSLRLYGNKTQLAEAIQNAGFPRMAERIEEGVALRVPCRVITKPSPDGKYLNIERVMPMQPPAGNGGWGR